MADGSNLDPCIALIRGFSSVIFPVFTHKVIKECFIKCIDSLINPVNLRSQMNTLLFDFFDIFFQKFLYKLDNEYKHGYY